MRQNLVAITCYIITLYHTPEMYLGHFLTLLMDLP